MSSHSLFNRHFDYRLDANAAVDGDDEQRKTGLFKKAYELGVLCSVDVAVIIFGEFANVAILFLAHTRIPCLFNNLAPVLSFIDNFVLIMVNFDEQRRFRQFSRPTP